MAKWKMSTNENIAHAKKQSKNIFPFTGAPRASFYFIERARYSHFNSSNLCAGCFAFDVTKK